MPESRKALRWIWLAIPVAVGAGALGWVLAPDWLPGSKAKRDASSQAPDEAAPPTGPRVGEALALLRDRRSESRQAVIDAYRDWASDPGAVAARKLLLRELFAEPNVAAKLSSVLTAIEADPTPAEKDPLWEHLAGELSKVWQGETAGKGMDLMVAETRPRARRALISSFAHLINADRFGELTQAQGQKLTEYFIDLHNELPPGQKPEVEQALRKVSGNDVVDILNKKGLGEDDHVLESERAYTRSLSETQQALARTKSAPPAAAPPPAPNDEYEGQ